MVLRVVVVRARHVRRVRAVGVLHVVVLMVRQVAEMKHGRSNKVDVGAELAEVLLLVVQTLNDFAAALPAALVSAFVVLRAFAFRTIVMGAIVMAMMLTRTFRAVVMGAIVMAVMLTRLVATSVIAVLRLRWVGRGRAVHVWAVLRLRNGAEFDACRIELHAPALVAFDARAVRLRTRVVRAQTPASAHLLRVRAEVGLSRSTLSNTNSAGFLAIATSISLDVSAAERYHLLRILVIAISTLGTCQREKERECNAREHSTR